METYEASIRNKGKICYVYLIGALQLPPLAYNLKNISNQ